MSSPEQTATGKDFSNPLMAVDLPKIQRLVFHLILKREETPSPEQTATGKDKSNPLMVVGLPKIQKGVQTPHNVDSSKIHIV